MEIGYRKTKSGRRLESPRWGMHTNRRRRKRVVRREDECSPVLSSVVRSVFRAGNYIMPFEDVRFGRMGGDIRRGVLGNRLVFSR